MSEPHALVIEDNAVNRRLTVDVLEDDGFAVTAVSDAAGAWRALTCLARPDVILVDIQLPGCDGLTLTRQLKSDRRFCDVPVVAVTAFALSGDDERACAAGCDGYLTKPIDVATFGPHVRRVMASMRAAA